MGLEAIADALRTNTVLTELKVANQRSPFSQASEEKLAACLEGNHTLVRLTADLRGSRARDPNPNPSPSPSPNPNPNPSPIPNPNPNPNPDASLHQARAPGSWRRSTSHATARSCAPG